MVKLVETYNCKMDAKGRIMLPSALKKLLVEEIKEGFVLKRSVFEPCLELYPMPAWNRLMDKLGKLNRFVKKNSDFIRKFTAGVKRIEVDATGRLLIPKNLVEVAGLEKELVLSSSQDIIEIWDKDRYEAVINIDDEDFGALTEEMLGDPIDAPDGLS